MDKFEELKKYIEWHRDYHKHRLKLFDDILIKAEELELSEIKIKKIKEGK